MADFTTIKTEIDANIVPFNDAQEITGEKLNTTLQDLVDDINDKKEDKILIATYGVTTKAQLEAAIASGRQVFVREGIDSAPLPLVSAHGGVYRFAFIGSDLVVTYAVLGEDGWDANVAEAADAYDVDQTKADKVHGATADNLAALDVNGNLKDSGVAAADVLRLIHDESAIDLSYRDVNGNLRAKRNTANCYVVRANGVYKLPLIYGNGIKDGAINTASFTKVAGQYTADFVNHRNAIITTPYIEDMQGCHAVGAILVWAEADNVIKNIHIGKERNGVRELYFDVENFPANGTNAIIGITDEDGDCIWSWHIWMTNDILTPVTLTNHTGVNYDILPLNLGWTWDDASKAHGKNVFYQWGRKDPMPSPAAYNSTGEHALYGTKTFQKVGAAEGIADGILNPNKFYVQDENNNNDWQSGIAARYNHWDASCAAAGASDNVVVKTIYDPSPVGYKMPNARLFTGFTTTGGNASTPEQFNVIDAFANGWKFKKNGEDVYGEFFAASGYRYRTSGGLLSVGSGGYYWSSAVYSAAYACSLYFHSGLVNPLHSLYRALGFAVRPVKE